MHSTSTTPVFSCTSHSVFRLLLFIFSYSACRPSFSMRFSATLVATVLSFSSLVAAHPGHDHSKEIEARAAFMKTSKRDLTHCAAKRQARGVETRAVARRAATAKAAPARRGLDITAPFLKARDEATVLNTVSSNSSNRML